MAVNTYKSAAITNRDASPTVHTNALVDGGHIRETMGAVTTVAADGSGSKYLLGTVPSRARISQMLLYSDDMGSLGAVDIGLARTTADGGADVHQTFFIGNKDLASGAVNGTDITHNVGNPTTLVSGGPEKAIWQLLGLSTDPGVMYDIVAKVRSASVDIGGNLVLKTRFCA